MDSTYKARQARNGACPGCRRRFAFEPREGARITDLGFKHAIDAVSANGHLNWGVEHLYYDVCRRVRRAGHSKRFLGGILLWVIAVAVLAAVIRLFYMDPADRIVVAVVVFALIGVWVYGWRLLRWSSTVMLPQADFTLMWDRWTHVHPSHLKGLIVRKEPLPPRRAAEPDIPLYSFDRAVICDRARTVDLLLANNFHFENNCAVLSIDGYPPGPFATVREMLKRNPQLHVFALHDATGPGCQMAHRLATEAEWFKGQARIIDVGLRPAHARRFSGLLLAVRGRPLHAGHGITDGEAAWLSRHALEIAAIRPEQVLKGLFRAINKPADKQPRRDRDRGDGGDGVASSGGRDPGEVTTSELMPAHEGASGGAGASGAWDTPDEASVVTFDADAFSTDAGDMDGDGDGSG